MKMTKIAYSSDHCWWCHINTEALEAGSLLLAGEMEESGDLGLSLLKARGQPPDTFKSQFLDFQILGYLYMLL